MNDLSSNTSLDSAFSEITQLIVTARHRAMQAVNTELIELHWQVGACISRKIEAAEWGDGVGAQLAEHLANTQPGLRGFTSTNLFRMRKFFEVYRHDVKVAALLRQLPWTQNLIILNQSKHPEEREFYLRMAIQEKWSSRELERQFKAALFERSVISPAKVSAPLRQIHPQALDVFKGAYVVEFLALERGHAETDLHGGLLYKLRDFLIELGRDYCFIGSQHPFRQEETGAEETRATGVETCKFDFAKHYGIAGVGLIDVHHTRPVHTLQPGEKTHLKDLVLLCSNCHRVVHSSKRWHDLEQLKATLAVGQV